MRVGDDVFTDENQLESELSRPSPALLAESQRWKGDIVILGAGGKMGTGVSSMAARALRESGRHGVGVTAVSRWSDPAKQDTARAAGVTPLTADLSDPDAVGRLPDAACVVFLVGAKFGTSTDPSTAWITNTVVPAYVMRRYADSRIVAMSTGNVYPMTPPGEGGSREDDDPAPVGDYAMSCLGRERVLSHGALAHGTDVTLLRLNYACEPRYGVIADIAKKVRDRAPIDLATGSVNVVWQRYVNEVILRCLTHSHASPFILNVTGPETASVRSIAEALGRRLGQEPQLVGEPGPTSLLSNASACHGIFGYPDATLSQLIDMQADWIGAGGPLWDKPTKFERRDGRF